MHLGPAGGSVSVIGDRDMLVLEGTVTLTLGDVLSYTRQKEGVQILM